MPNPIRLTIAMPIALLAAAALTGACVAGDDGDTAQQTVVRDPTSEPTPPDDLTPAPHSPFDPAVTPQGTAGPIPSQPTSVEIASVVIPIPEGAHVVYGAGPGTELLYWVSLGESRLRFDDHGLRYANLTQAHARTFEPTLDSLWSLQSVGTPSPESINLDGLVIPLPAGSYYSTVDNAAENISRTYIVRLGHSVLSFDNRGIAYHGIAAEDNPEFASTIESRPTLPPAR